MHIRQDTLYAEVTIRMHGDEVAYTTMSKEVTNDSPQVRAFVRHYFHLPDNKQLTMRRTARAKQKMRRTVPKKMVWYEDYHGCKCTYIADTQQELPSCCPIHDNNKRRHEQIPDVGFVRGFVQS